MDIDLSKILPPKLSPVSPVKKKELPDVILTMMIIKVKLSHNVKLPLKLIYMMTIL